MPDLRRQTMEQHIQAHNLLDVAIQECRSSFNDTELELLKWISKIQKMKADDLKTLLNMWLWAET